jgi:hypothetical protein
VVVVKPTRDEDVMWVTDDREDSVQLSLVMAEEPGGHASDQVNVMVAIGLNTPFKPTQGVPHSAAARVGLG